MRGPKHLLHGKMLDFLETMHFGAVWLLFLHIGQYKTLLNFILINQKS
jgi:hypothetical protein